MKEGKVVIFCAPSGTGKTTITRRMMALFPELTISISVTSRDIRGGETEGVEYHFVSTEEFKRMTTADEFVEWEEVYPGRYYGTLKRELDRLFALGKVPVFDIDVKGAINVKRLYGDHALLVFVKAPVEMITARLKARATDSPESIQARIDRFPFEMSYEDKADVVIENIDLEKAVADTATAVKKFLENELPTV
jgi:guanylate kinase